MTTYDDVCPLSLGPIRFNRYIQDHFTGVNTCTIQYMDADDTKIRFYCCFFFPPVHLAYDVLRFLRIMFSLKKYAGLMSRSSSAMLGGQFVRTVSLQWWWTGTRLVTRFWRSVV